MKIRLAGTELFHTDWQTNRRTADRRNEADSHFSHFCQRA